MQRFAEEQVWGPAVEALCASQHIAVAYQPFGSDAGMTEWNYDLLQGFPSTENSYIGTAAAPNETQLKNMEKNAEGAKVVVIPVAMTSIAIIANPPLGCEVEVITNSNLAGVFEGRIRNWKNLEGAEGECNSPITRVVRRDRSGVTYQFKNYLGQVFKKGLACTSPIEGPGTEGRLSWLEMAPLPEGSYENAEGIVLTPDYNAKWPEWCEERELGEVARPPYAGGGEFVRMVNQTEGTVGYAALSDVKAFASGGTIILALQNNGQKKGGEANFANPSAGTTANCGATPFTGFKTNTGIDVDWSGVFGAKPAIGGKGYPLCMLTYDLAFHASKNAGFTEDQELTVRDYLYEYVVQSAGQEALIKSGYFYSALPSSPEPQFDVLGAARKAAKEISW